ncbi:MAG: replication protein P [Telluria sp.]
MNSWSVPHEVKDANGDPTGRLLSAIDRLYARFASMYMHKWSSHFTSADMIEDWKKAWSSALLMNGVTFQLAFEGIERCSREYPKWPPSEGEFVALCKPALDYEQAFYDAVRLMQKRAMNDPADPDIWPEPAVYWAAQDFGQFELRQVTYGQASTRWKKLLDNRRGPDCPAVPQYAPQLAAPARNADGVAITSAEAKEAARAALRALVTRRPSKEVSEERARATLARHEAGEVVPTYLLSHARHVLAALAMPDPDDEPL